MTKIVAYLRASTDKQDLNHQKLELLEFARKKSLSIDEFIEITISSRKTSKQRRIDESKNELQKVHDVIKARRQISCRNRDQNTEDIGRFCNVEIMTVGRLLELNAVTLPAIPAMNEAINAVSPTPSKPLG